MPVNFKNYADLAATIHRNLPMIAAQEFDLVAGVPRSGIIPAFMIALDLNIAVCSLNDLADDHNIQRYGNTRKIKSTITHPAEAKKILIVDDSYNTGQSLAAQLATLPAAIRSHTKTMAIYAATPNPNLDFYLELVPQPRIFEWNIFHHESTVAGSCFDLDGVLCEDPTDEQNDDGEQYLMFIQSARPKYIPTHKIKTIITSRLEKYRPQTEAWLKKHHVHYGKLVMLSGYTAAERRKKGVHAAFKVQEYRHDDYTLFIESNHTQAKTISQLSHKPVYCVDANAMIYPEPEQMRQAAAALKVAVKKHKWLRALLLPPYKLYRVAKSRIS